MELVFMCPVTHQTFQTDAFSIVDHHGVRTDAKGHKHLDAKVRVDIPCPFCGAQHVYSADELACPFGQSSGTGSGGIRMEQE